MNVIVNNRLEIDKDVLVNECSKMKVNNVIKRKE